MTRFVISLFLVFIFHSAISQSFFIKGVVRDHQSDEPLPFASVFFKINTKGVLTDSSGRFSIDKIRVSASDTLVISSIGYKKYLIPVALITDTAELNIRLEILPPTNETVVKAKYSRALWFWKKIMKNKPLHDRNRWNNFYYESYNKLELDLMNINQEKVKKNKLFKPLDFVLKFVDSTSEAKPFLPAYLTETISEYYHQKDPLRSREIITATRTNGLKNESLIKELGSMYQVVNVYANFIPIFGKQFISPFNEHADNYYKFKLLDTQYLANKRLVHFKFIPKHTGDDVFEGDCWVHDTSFAIQKITMRPSTDANINFITGLTLIQEFKQIKDSIWFIYKDKFVADVSPIGKENLSLKGRKTTTYKNIMLDSNYVVNKLNEVTRAEQVDLVDGSRTKPDSFWQKNRHEKLNKTENAVYVLLDTLINNPTYIRYKNIFEFATTGVKDIGKFRIGPWANWLSNNAYEGFGLRFDLSTNRNFSKHWLLSTYLGYDFKHDVVKGKGQVRYEFNREPWSYIDATYKRDLDITQSNFTQLGNDNIIASLLRRSGIPFKFQRLEEKKLEAYAETNSGFDFGITATDKQYTALLNLPGSELFPKTSGDNFNTFETKFKLRFAYLEKTIFDNYTRRSLGSKYPIIELNLTHGWKGVMNSSYDYNKLSISLGDVLKIAPYGKITYNFFGGKVWGALPYQLLEVHPGSEVFYYDRTGFNLMNKFEYISDKYAGFNIEHNMGFGLFKYIGFTRKLKLRQLWTFKSVIGDLSTENRQLNFVGNYPFKSLNGKMYAEVGTAIANIFKLIRIDFVWRILPEKQPYEKYSKWGIFGSYQISF